MQQIHPIDQLGLGEVQFIYPKLAKEFSHIPLNELAWLSFWMVLTHSDESRHA
jgi:hypothetical protein